MELRTVVGHPVFRHPFGVAITRGLTGLHGLAVGPVDDLSEVVDLVIGDELRRELLARRAVERGIDGLPRINLHPRGEVGVEQREVGVLAEPANGRERVAEAVVGKHWAGDVQPVINQLLGDTVDTDDLVETGCVELGVPVDGQLLSGLPGQGREDILRVVLHVPVVALSLASEVAHTEGQLVVDGSAEIDAPLRVEVALTTGNVGSPAAQHFSVETIKVRKLGDEVHITARALSLGAVNRGTGSLDDVHGLHAVEAGEHGIAAVNRPLTVLVNFRKVTAYDWHVGQTVTGRGVNARGVLIEIGGTRNRAGFHLGLGHQRHRARGLQNTAVVTHDRLDRTSRRQNRLFEGQTFDDDLVQNICGTSTLCQG